MVESLVQSDPKTAELLQAHGFEIIDGYTTEDMRTDHMHRQAMDIGYTALLVAPTEPQYDLRALNTRTEQFAAEWQEDLEGAEILKQHGLMHASSLQLPLVIRNNQVGEAAVTTKMTFFDTQTPDRQEDETCTLWQKTVVVFSPSEPIGRMVPQLYLMTGNVEGFAVSYLDKAQERQIKAGMIEGSGKRRTMRRLHKTSK